MSAARFARTSGPSPRMGRHRVSLAAVAPSAWTNQIFEARASLVALAVRWALTAAQVLVVVSAAARVWAAVLYQDLAEALAVGLALVVARVLVVVSAAQAWAAVSCQDSAAALVVGSALAAARVWVAVSYQD